MYFFLVEHNHYGANSKWQRCFINAGLYYYCYVHYIYVHNDVVSSRKRSSLKAILSKK